MGGFMKMKRVLYFLLLLAMLALPGCGGGGSGRGSSGVSSSVSGGSGEEQGGPSSDQSYRGAMRDFVQAICSYARRINANFIVIPQNGVELLSMDGEVSGSPAANYIRMINGIGQEDLFYGYDADNVATKAEDRDYLLAWMDYAKGQGLKVLVTDYCSTRHLMDDSYSNSFRRGYISFAADRRELNDIPSYPATPFGVNTSDITNLADAKNFLYLINPSGYNTKDALINAICATNYDVVIMDLFFNNSEQLTAADIQKLKRKANGGRRLVIAYMSIGQAEDYRYYWNASWRTNPPSWLERVDPNWPGNYWVRYWDPEWQRIIYGNNQSYTYRIIQAGFDGVYLDIIDGFEHFEVVS